MKTGKKWAVPVCEGGGCNSGRTPDHCDCKDPTLGACGAPYRWISLRGFVLAYCAFLGAIFWLVVETW